VNPNIEELRKLRVGHIVSFNDKPNKYKLIEVKENDEFVFEQLTDREARVELKALTKVNEALKRRWVIG
jgi:mannose/fructose/N-acetylgalactosamine-specific phosphotransferase system component IIB